MKVGACGASMNKRGTAQTLASLMGKRGMEAGNSEPYAPCSIPAKPPFGGWRHHLCPGGKRVTGFSGYCVPLQIQFPVRQFGVYSIAR